MARQEQLADVLLPFTQRVGDSVESGTPIKLESHSYNTPSFEFLLLFFCTFVLRLCVTGESGTLVESGLKKWAGGGPPPIPLRTERMHCTAPLPAAARDGCPYPLAVRSVGQLSLSSRNLSEGKRGFVQSTGTISIGAAHSLTHNL